MTKTHKQIPLLEKLRISYFCDKCHREIPLRYFYKAIDKVIEAASIEDGKLICGMCWDKPLGSKE